MRESEGWGRWSLRPVPANLLLQGRWVITGFCGAQIYTHIVVHRWVCTRTHTRTDTRGHTHGHTSVGTQTQTRVGTQTYARAHTHRSAHSNTQTQERVGQKVRVRPVGLPHSVSAPAPAALTLGQRHRSLLRGVRTDGKYPRI